ncbi:flagellar type III secretion system pore protein FliP [Novosphingobium sp. AAP93]|uniref:flagellar type III secretion system pore protein FliP n=1 Tax=Novosphingobium sp. AAP93 TaxID=1523427 RepID=UPI0006CCF0AF|nr:flagellar type III secretion system pore protein FliP [Novosphingobium sp. AAP93]KPF77594.1 flagellar biosynthesis protein flip [Novosphingobium sp. AAP93]
MAASGLVAGASALGKAANLDVLGPVTGGSDIVRTIVVLTLVALIPAVLLSMTSFIRIIITLSMVRHAFGMPETPPNPVLISLALFLTAFSMGPTVDAINRDALQPYLASKQGLEQTIDRGSKPLRSFMLAQTSDADIEAIYGIAHVPPPSRPEDVEITKLAPAFIINELRASFTIGFVILLPFLLIDLVVSAILLALGMMMVPPSTISLPIKLLMFVLIDGWSLIIQGVLGSFR